MKQPPDLTHAAEEMQPGHVTQHGLLGDDTRPLAEILDHDGNTVRRLGLTHAQIADRMEYFARAGEPGLGTSVTVDDKYEVKVETVRGVLPCPWPHKGVFGKGYVELTNRETGQTLWWTPLSVHMIREHGFYEGRGSAFRIDPERAARVLGLA